MYSLKNRITRNLTINMIAVMSVLLIVMYFFMQQLLQDYVLTRLQHDAESLITVLEKDSNGGWRIRPASMATVYDRVRSGHYFQVEAGSQQLTSRSLFDADFPVITQASPIDNQYLLPGPGSETWLLWIQHVEKNGESIKIQIAEDIEPIRYQLLEYTILALVLVLVVTGLLIYLQQRTISRAFYIFEWLRQNLSAIRYRQTQAPELEIPQEIAPLAAEIEKLIEHLRQRIDRTRNAIGNMAHELKRPLQLLALQDNPEQTRPLDDIKNIIERELKRAKISGLSTSTGELDLAKEMPFMIEVIEKIYPRIKVDLIVQNHFKTRDLDRDDLFELSGNLLDNACKFGRSRVQLTLAGDDSRFLLTVDDDGEGVDSSEIAKIQQRGTRLDETIDGHGLGLGICRDIVDSYQGDISFSASALGGLSVRVEIPLQQT